MSDHDERPRDEGREEDGTAGSAPGPEGSGSVLSGFTWDDPAAGSPGAPGSADQDRAGSSTAPDEPGPAPAAFPSPAEQPTPAAYPPPAPYPPAASTPAGSTPAGSTPAGSTPAGSTPAGSTPVAPSDPYGTSAAGGYSPAGEPSQPAPAEGSVPQPSGPPDAQQTYAAQPYAQQPYAQQPYAPGQPVAPEQGPYAQQPYGQQQPYGLGYGQSASYTSTPQPYAYGPPPLSPEAEKVRSAAILWTILNGITVFTCGNVLLGIPGALLAGLAIGKVRDDLPGARNFVRWSWILFAVGVGLLLLAFIAYIVLVVVLGTAGMSSGF